MEPGPRVTVVIPSYNQGAFLDEAISSVFHQTVGVEVFVLDNASSDSSVEIIRKWAPQLAGWRSRKDEGQASAINEGVSLGTAPYICWLNSDDMMLEDCLKVLVSALGDTPEAPAVYGRVWNMNHKTKRQTPVWVEPFDPKRLALRCIISQPATLIRRTAWEAVSGLNPTLHLAMDYDLWWRLFKECGQLEFIDAFVAINREHSDTKTSSFRREHYKEAMGVVREHFGKVPLKWWLFQPYAVWLKSLIRKVKI